MQPGPRPRPSLVALMLVGASVHALKCNQDLADTDCKAWVDLYDATGGNTTWTQCRNNRLDPCTCSWDEHNEEHGVVCARTISEGLRIIKL